VLFAAAFNLLGPLLVGAAVASTLTTVVTVPGEDAVRVIGAGLVGALAWNVASLWRGLPASSGHALVGGLVGAALMEAGTGAVRWGGFDGVRPVGVVGVLVSLAAAPVLAAGAGLVVLRLLRRLLRRATRRLEPAVRVAQRAGAAWLALVHGSNDAQKAAGVIAALLIAGGEASGRSAPGWAVVGSSVALATGTTLGGWGIVRTVGRRIYPVRPLDSVASQASSASVILLASLLGAPVSTTQVVASSVVGVGGGRRRWRHVDWVVVREIAAAWAVTIPATGVMAALALLAWRSVS
jgi:PiT family inorganic phosphate transporter